MIKIKLYKATNGDAFLLSLGGNENVLIDGGKKSTYEDIKPDLLKLKDSGGVISLLVVSHIDSDHIGGIIPLIEENGNTNEIVPIKQIWYNSYRHIRTDIDSAQLDQNSINILQGLINRNQYPKEDGVSSISVKEGMSLTRAISENSYSWNTDFDCGAVSIDNHTKIKISDRTSVILLSPNNIKLNKLEKKWKTILDHEMEGITLTEDSIIEDAFEYSCKDEISENVSITDCSMGNDDIERLRNIEMQDLSATNGSSVAFIIESEGCKILFLGDAHEDIIYEQLSVLSNGGYPLDFDLVKLSHHGSNKNISTRMLSLINSNRFVISTDGSSHGHPDLSTIAKIITSNKEIHKELIFNYKIDSVYDKYLPLQEQYNFSIIITNEVEICTK